MSVRFVLSLFTCFTLTACSLFDVQSARDCLSCSAFKGLAVNMPHESLYTIRAGQCAPVADPDDESMAGSTFYTDAACRQETEYKPTSFLTYCKNNLLEPANHRYIGNAAAWRDETSGQYAAIGKNSKWTLGHGPTLDVLALSPRGNHRPFMKQVEYRIVNDCHLEMRVYKKEIAGENLKPLILIHGGAWKYRGFGAVAGESLISHLTERGFVVFEPYHRLMGKADGPAECQIPGPVDNVSPGEMIVSDIEYALEWVKRHGEVLGASAGAPVSLVGHSSGAHLAGWLAAYHGSDIDKVLVFYTPADIENYIQELGRKYSWDHEGKAVIQRLIGVNLTFPPTNLPPFVAKNSFPKRIRAGADFPPIFMVHGNRDTLVPVDMSTRMCEALRDPAGSMAIGAGRFRCGTRRGVNNILYVIDKANHMLDIKCFVDPAIAALLGDNFKELRKLCPSGSASVSKNVVRPAMREGLDWISK